MGPCDICLEKDCSHPGQCNCDTCNKRDYCNKRLKPTIRITKKCTQTCIHCAFSCSSERNEMMSVEMAEKIVRFMKSNGIQLAEIMGGEFFMNPDWFQVITILAKDLDYVRLVSNGDWAGDTELARQAVNLMKSLPHMKMSISKDRWHTNRWVDEADRILTENDILHNVATPEETTPDSIVPIGRGELVGAYGFYGCMGCYCRNPKEWYTFLINEIGEIAQCPLGAWKYNYIENYLDGGFRARFKEFGLLFQHKVFFPSCRWCLLHAGGASNVA